MDIKLRKRNNGIRSSTLPVRDLFVTESSRKRNSGNSIHSGLTDQNVIQYLDEYFKKLESSRSPDAIQLVKTIIMKFGTIFHLWEENRFFQSKIDRSVFESIHKAMSNVFSDHVVDESGNFSDNLLFTLICKQCKKSFPLKKKNCMYSFQCHTISKEHTEFLKNSNNKDDTIAASDSDLQMETISKAGTYEYDQLFMHARCYLCSENIKLNNSPNNMGDKAVSDCLLAHMRTKIHLENSNLFQYNQQYVEEVDKNKKVFRCTLCDVYLFIDELVQHFVTEEHKAIKIVNKAIDDFLKRI